MIAATFLETIFAYNTLVVLAGTMLLGIASGTTGTFMLLRRRALAGDVIGHSALPGVAIAFLIHAALFPDAGKSLPAMLLGGSIASVIAMLSVMWLRQVAKLSEDSALAIVLSTFFSLGIVLLSVVLDSPTGSQAGMRDFIFGQAAALRKSDVMLIGGIALFAFASSLLLLKEWTLLCFDEGLASVMGYRIWLLDLLLMTLVVCVCVTGMQAVGLLLIVALLVIPPAAARFWSDSIYPNLWISAAVGALSAVTGGIGSAMLPRMPTGALIVIAGALFLGFSILFGRKHGLVFRFLARKRLTSRQASQAKITGAR